MDTHGYSDTHGLANAEMSRAPNERNAGRLLSSLIKTTLPLHLHVPMPDTVLILKSSSNKGETFSWAGFPLRSETELGVNAQRRNAEGERKVTFSAAARAIPEGAWWFSDDRRVCLRTADQAPEQYDEQIEGLRPHASDPVHTFNPVLASSWTAPLTTDSACAKTAVGFICLSPG